MLSAIRHNTRLLTLALCAVVAALASCRDGQDDPTAPAQEAAQAIFTISLGDDSSRAGRATPTDGEYDEGAGLENYIDIEGGDYACYLFTTDNVLVSRLMVTKIYKIVTEASGRTYSVIATLRPYEEEAIEGGCKLVVLANWGTYPAAEPGRTTIASLCSSDAARLAYTSEMSALSEANLIPMYGVKTIAAGAAVKDIDTYNVGRIRLLRALAKVEVKVKFEGFAEADPAPQLKAVGLTNCYDAAYKVQAEEHAQDESGYVHGSWALDYTPVRIPAGAAASPLAFKTDESGAYVVYVPEYDNLDAGGNERPDASRARIAITLVSGGDERTAYVDFRQTSEAEGKCVDIARNNWYKFNVTVKPAEVIWIADVKPYTSVELEPGFGILPNANN